MTYEERILEALRLHGSTDDDELSRRTGIRPRQQVNQICRRLEARGNLVRRVGPLGKIVNELRDAARAEPRIVRPVSASVRAQATCNFAPIGSRRPLPTALLERTLFVIPCSGAKRAGGVAVPAASGLVDHIPSELGGELQKARIAVAEKAQVREGLLLPAAKRYTGSFYVAAEGAWRHAKGRSLHVLIISGGYGLVTPDELIGDYEAVFNLSWWPRGLLQDVLLSCSHTCGHSWLPQRHIENWSRPHDGKKPG